jgi:hypothetical protein
MLHKKERKNNADGVKVEWVKFYRKGAWFCGGKDSELGRLNEKQNRCRTLVRKEPIEWMDERYHNAAGEHVTHSAVRYSTRLAPGLKDASGENSGKRLTERLPGKCQISMDKDELHAAHDRRPSARKRCALC